MTVEVAINGEVLGRGTAWERCLAERAAAAEALRTLQARQG